MKRLNEDRAEDLRLEEELFKDLTQPMSVERSLLIETISCEKKWVDHTNRDISNMAEGLGKY